VRKQPCAQGAFRVAPVRAGERAVKVVLFAGGLGLRIQEAAPSIPKPMVPIANRPILLHIMKYYAHFGHDDFIVCLGHKGDVIKEFFLNYNEALANDFVLSGGGRHVELLGSDIGEWRITFVNTGLHSNIGQRLRAVRKHLQGEEFFLATYGDAVTDAPLPKMIANFHERGKTAAFLCVRPTSYSFHTVRLSDGQLVRGIEDVTRSDMWINGGFFVFRPEIFDYIEEGEELVEEPFRRLIEREELLAYPYEGFWAPMDTLKDKHNLEALAASGQAPWEIWTAPDGDTSTESSWPC
jgi:glucose-1-phosphate cytidylyltransferase